VALGVTALTGLSGPSWTNLLHRASPTKTRCSQTDPPTALPEELPITLPKWLIYEAPADTFDSFRKELGELMHRVLVHGIDDVQRSCKSPEIAFVELSLFPIECKGGFLGVLGEHKLRRNKVVGGRKTDRTIGSVQQRKILEMHVSVAGQE